MRILLLIFLLSKLSYAEEKVKRIYWCGSLDYSNTLAFWFEKYHEIKPKIQFYSGKSGSWAAFPPINMGLSHMGPMTRDPKPEEIEAYTKKHGVKPKIIKLGYYPIFIVAQKGNPVIERGLSLPEIDAIFSKNRNRGYKKRISKWSNLNIIREDDEIKLYGRNSASGTYGFFCKKVLNKGEFHTKINQLPGNSSILQAIHKNPSSLAYAYFKDPQFDAVPIPIIVNKEKVHANFENMASGKYPLVRSLTMLVQPNPIPEVKGFLKFTLSEQGQKILIDNGYLPLSKNNIKVELEKFK